MKLDPVNPKLQAVMEEIKTILRREDIAASVALCSGEQSQYLNWCAHPHGPTWSALIWDADSIRFRAKAKTGNHVERWKFVSTLKAINTLRKLHEMQFLFYHQLCDATKDYVEPGGEESHVPSKR